MQRKLASLHTRKVVPIMAKMLQFATNFSSFLRGSVGGNKVVASLPNTRTLVRGLSLSIMRCASGAQLDVVLAERSIPCKFVGTLHVFLPTFSQDGLLGSQKESLRSHPP
mmetsp:Transcript_29898/g.43729  ORF Transcript_29898/g.43729 Transcript_29898/m.43729 type:complete len:110 (+) Transcript_29898:273-602(+)